jgi:hypothetical protein
VKCKRYHMPTAALRQPGGIYGGVLIWVVVCLSLICFIVKGTLKEIAGSSLTPRTELGSVATLENVLIHNLSPDVSKPVSGYSGLVCFICGSTTFQYRFVLGIGREKSDAGRMLQNTSQLFQSRFVNHAILNKNEIAVRSYLSGKGLAGVSPNYAAFNGFPYLWNIKGYIEFRNPCTLVVSRCGDAGVQRSFALPVAGIESLFGVVSNSLIGFRAMVINDSERS